MKVHIKVSMNINSTVKFGNFPSQLAVKFALNSTAEADKRQCSKQLPQTLHNISH